MFLRGLGTAHPERRYTKADCWESFQKSPWFEQLDRRSRTIAEMVLRGDNGIEARRLALASLDEVFQIDPDTLHARFIAHAPRLAAQAAERALADASTERGAIDGLVVSTCTGYLCPGLSGHVVEQLGLARDLRAFDLVGHGCAAALPNWQMADALLASGQCANVLSVCVEVSSAAMYLDNDPGVLISACLFGDGAGAAVLTADCPPDKRRVECKAIGSLLNPGEREALRFEQRRGMLRNVLTRPVPRLAAEHAEQVLDGVLDDAGLSARRNRHVDLARGRPRRAARAAQQARAHRGRRALQRGDAARVRQLEQRVRVLRARSRARGSGARRLVVDVVVRRGVQLPRRAARGRVNNASTELASERFPRRVLPELLDELPADDPRAVRSRRDLRLVNRIMGAKAALLWALDAARVDAPQRIVELGAGDGSMALRIARARARAWPGVSLTLLDLNPVVGAQTLTAIRKLGWEVDVAAADALEWLARTRGRELGGVRESVRASLRRRAPRALVRGYRGERAAVRLLRAAAVATRARGQPPAGAHRLQRRHASRCGGERPCRVSRRRAVACLVQRATERLDAARIACRSVRPFVRCESRRMSARYDAIVIGAGVAGATAAILLARAGWSVAVIEKSSFPRRKVCGECIAAPNLGLLDALGIGAELTALAGPPLERVALFVGDQTVIGDLPPLPGAHAPWGRALGRDRLDALLLQRARAAGAAVWQPCTARETVRDASGYVCRIVAGETGLAEELHAPVLIAANGSWEPAPIGAQHRAPAKPSDLFAFKANFTDAALAPGLLPVLAFPGGYGGMVIADGGRLTLACCVRRDRLREWRAATPGAAGAATQALLEESCAGVRAALRGARREGAWLSVGPIRPGIRAAWNEHTGFAIGNAAGEAHPILGEGISMAIQSAALLCRQLGAHRADALRGDHAPIAKAYARAWRRQFRSRIRFAALLAQLAMRPGRAAWLLPVLRRWPTLLTAAARVGGKVRPVPEFAPNNGLGTTPAYNGS